MARDVDDHNMSGMDLYASTMIHAPHDTALEQLNELARTLMQVLHSFTCID